MSLFFAEELSETGGQLSADESHHAARVLRLSTGDEILTTQGKGIIYRSRLLSLGKKHSQFENIEVFKDEKRGKYLHIAIAPTKSNDRFESFLEKATEAGVDEITPVICKNSERKVYKTERGKKILKAGAKQSLACWWPTINEPVLLKNFLPLNFEGFSKYIAHCEDMDQPNVLPKLQQVEKLLMLIGPEGDFTPSEIKSAQEAAFTQANLGPKRLRTETAGMVVSFAHKLL